MSGVRLSSEDEVLLPAYIGWSSREGSGVFDPVEETGVRFQFYRITRQAEIDLDDLHSKLKSRRPKLLVLIHYFGFPDPNLAQAAALGREYGAIVLEDEAHALYTDWIGGICGRFGDAAILSLHKMLPLPTGGLLLLNPSMTTLEFKLPDQAGVTGDTRLLEFDLWQIAATRRRNAQELLDLLPRLKGRVDPLYSTLPPGVAPQTIPVIITGKSRDELYFMLNSIGYGVVTLYHTLIDAITRDEFPDSHWLARHIMNLPVHQDILPGQLANLVEELAAAVR